MKCRILKLFFLCFVGTILFAGTVHEVKKGETLYSISRMYGSSVDAIKSLNGLSGNSLKVGQKLKIPDSEPKPVAAASSSSETSAETYIVQKGDSWYGIARKNGISLSELLSINNASEKTSLGIGQKIKLKASSTATTSSSVAANTGRTSDDDGYYTVQKGDSLLVIAKNFGLSYSEIMDMNGLNEKSTIKIGQKLKVSAPMPALAENDPREYSSKKGDTSLVWPVRASNVTYVKGKVGGVNLSAKSDEAVTAVMDGNVMFAGSYRGFGNVVFIQSKTGHIYAYTGLGNVLATKGQYVQTGEKIGTAGVDTRNFGTLEFLRK